MIRVMKVWRHYQLVDDSHFLSVMTK